MKQNDFIQLIRRSLPPARRAALCCLALLAAASCSKDEPGSLPPGSYPLTFAATVDGLTLTRATADNTYWTGSEEVAVHTANDVKKYIPASGNPATLSGADAANTFYWHRAGETKQVSAWYCGTGYNATPPATWTVQTDQSGEGCRQSDILYAAPQDFTYATVGSSRLTFRHLTAKVVVNLKQGDGLTADEVAGATVSIVNQATTSGAIDHATGTMAQTAPGNAEIIPRLLPTPEAGCLKSVQALLVPQQMQGEKFIKVTVGTGNAARNYYYTPAAADDADLLGGKQYTYNITVKKTGLEVALNTAVSWDDTSINSGAVAEATFRITLVGQSLPALINLNGIAPTGTPNLYETTGGNSFSFDFVVPNGEESKGFPILKGMADMSRTGDAVTYTFTYTNVRSDLWLEYTEYTP